jgi:hypothetical protein
VTDPFRSEAPALQAKLQRLEDELAELSTPDPARDGARLLARRASVSAVLRALALGIVAGPLAGFAIGRPPPPPPAEMPTVPSERVPTAARDAARELEDCTRAFARAQRSLVTCYESIDARRGLAIEIRPPVIYGDPDQEPVRTTLQPRIEALSECHAEKLRVTISFDITGAYRSAKVADYPELPAATRACVERVFAPKSAHPVFAVVVLIVDPRPPG